MFKVKKIQDSDSVNKQNSIIPSTLWLFDLFDYSPMRFLTLSTLSTFLTFSTP